MNDENDRDKLLSRASPPREDNIAPEAAKRMEELERELTAASKTVGVLYRRLRAGETEVGPEFEIAKRREDERRAEFLEFRKSLGIVDVPIMYGPPWRFGREE